MWRLEYMTLSDPDPGSFISEYEEYFYLTQFSLFCHRITWFDTISENVETFFKIGLVLKNQSFLPTSDYMTAFATYEDFCTFWFFLLRQRIENVFEAFSQKIEVR